MNIRFVSIISTAAVLIAGCGIKSSSISKSNSSDATTYTSGSCVVQEAAKEAQGLTYESCFMTKSSIETSASAKSFCENIAQGRYSASVCNQEVFARTCEVEGTIKSNGQTFSKTTISYYSAGSKTPCTNGVEKAIIPNGGKSSASPIPSQTTTSIIPSPKINALIGSCTSSVTYYCSEMYSPYYDAVSQKKFCLRTQGQTWSDTGCSPDMSGGAKKPPGMCKTVNKNDKTSMEIKYMYGWDATEAQKFCAPRVLSLQEITWVPN